ncbi:MAG: hypothetical protein MSD82_09670 [Prevotella sp.]|nr:hypothetical protein [Prevotella sp.]
MFIWLVFISCLIGFLEVKATDANDLRPSGEVDPERSQSLPLIPVETGRTVRAVREFLLQRYGHASGQAVIHVSKKENFVSSATDMTYFFYICGIKT